MGNEKNRDVISKVPTLIQENRKTMGLVLDKDYFSDLSLVN